MRRFHRKWLAAVIVAAVGLLIGFSSVTARPLQTAKQIAAPELVLTLDPAQSAVHYTVDSTLHTVHGTFALIRGTVQFDPETDERQRRDRRFHTQR